MKTILVCTSLLQKLGHDVPVFVVCEQEEAFALLQREVSEPIYLLKPDRMLERAVETMQRERPATQSVVAGDNVEVSDDSSRLLIAANDRVKHKESDDLVISSLLELHPLCERRRAEGNPLEIACMLHFDKNVEPAERAGANETVLVGRLLADKIGGLIKRA